MSKLDDLETLAQEVSATTIMVLPKRCTYIRNWNSKCKACLNACHHDAISRNIGRLIIDNEKCTNCGACACACPTSAFLTSSPDQSAIVKAAREKAERYGKIACFTCEKEAAELDIDQSRVVVLPCLNYLDEYLICGLLACGVQNVALLCRSCEGCDIDGSHPFFEAMVKSARSMLKAWDVSGRVKIFREIPPSLCDSGMKGRYSKGDRRDALTQTGGSAMEYVVQSVDEMITGKKAQPKNNSGKQVVVKSDEVFPAGTYRGPRILSMLDRIAQRPKGITVSSRFWATVDLDYDKCKKCGCCAAMCATRALSYEQDLPENPTRSQRRSTPGSLVFDPTLCIACGLCQDSCMRHAIKMTDRVPISDLDGTKEYYLFKDELQNFNNKYGF